MTRSFGPRLNQFDEQSLAFGPPLDNLGELLALPADRRSHGQCRLVGNVLYAFDAEYDGGRGAWRPISPTGLDVLMVPVNDITRPNELGDEGRYDAPLAVYQRNGQQAHTIYVWRAAMDGQSSIPNGYKGQVTDSPYVVRASDGGYWQAVAGRYRHRGTMSIGGDNPLVLSSVSGQPAFAAAPRAGGQTAGLIRYDQPIDYAKPYLKGRSLSLSYKGISRHMVASSRGEALPTHFGGVAIPPTGPASYGVVETFQNHDRNLTITNQYDGVAAILALSLDDPDSPFSVVSPVPLFIQPNSSANLTIRFNGPLPDTAYSDTLRLICDDTEQPGRAVQLFARTSVEVLPPINALLTGDFVTPVLDDWDVPAFTSPVNNQVLVVADDTVPYEVTFTYDLGISTLSEAVWVSRNSGFGSATQYSGGIDVSDPGSYGVYYWWVQGLDSNSQAYRFGPQTFFLAASNALVADQGEPDLWLCIDTASEERIVNMVAYISYGISEYACLSCNGADAVLTRTAYGWGTNPSTFGGVSGTADLIFEDTEFGGGYAAFTKTFSGDNTVTNCSGGGSADSINTIVDGLTKVYILPHAITPNVFGEKFGYYGGIDVSTQLQITPATLITVPGNEMTGAGLATLFSLPGATCVSAEISLGFTNTSYKVRKHRLDVTVGEFCDTAAEFTSTGSTDTWPGSVQLFLYLFGCDDVDGMRLYDVIGQPLPITIFGDGVVTANVVDQMQALMNAGDTHEKYFWGVSDRADLPTSFDPDVLYAYFKEHYIADVQATNGTPDACCPESLVRSTWYDLTQLSFDLTDEGPCKMKIRLANHVQEEPPETPPVSFEYWGRYFYYQGGSVEDTQDVSMVNLVKENDIIAYMPREERLLTQGWGSLDVSPQPELVVGNYNGGISGNVIYERYGVALFRLFNDSGGDIEFQIVPVQSELNILPRLDGFLTSEPEFTARFSSGNLLLNELPTPIQSQAAITMYYPEFDDEEGEGWMYYEPEALPAGSYVHLRAINYSSYLSPTGENVLNPLIVDGGGSPDPVEYDTQARHMYDLEYWPVGEPGNVTKLRFGIQLFADPE